MRISRKQLPLNNKDQRRRNRGALRKQRPYLRLNRFQGVRSLTRKENSGWGFPQCFRVHLRYRAKFSR
ncbi:ATP-dependent permease AUS1 [Dirofilaria immitis]